MQQYQSFEMQYTPQIWVFIHQKSCVSIVAIIAYFCLNKESM